MVEGDAGGLANESHGVAVVQVYKGSDGGRGAAEEIDPA